jgi:hypothetical protein
VITPREPEEQLDLRAVVRDDELLDRIAAGVRLGDSADPAVALLQALVRDVDAGLDAVVEQPLAPVEAEDSRWLRHRRLTLRGTAVAAVIGLGLSVGGVSAAVTGNPLAAYESVAGVFDSSDELPPNAAEIAKWNKKVVAARESVRSGDSATAHAQLDALRAMIGDLDVSDGRRAVLERKLAKLEERLESGAARKGPVDRPKKADDGRTAGKSAGQGDRPADRPTERGEGADQSDRSDKPEPGNDGVPAENPPAEQPAGEKAGDKGRDSSDPGSGAQDAAPSDGTAVEGDAPAGPVEDKGSTSGGRGNGRR